MEPVAKAEGYMVVIEVADEGDDDDDSDDGSHHVDGDDNCDWVNNPFAEI